MSHPVSETCPRIREIIMAKLPSDNQPDRRAAPDNDDEPRHVHDLERDEEKDPLTGAVTKNTGVKNN
jgi:hypothetical protein